MENYNVNKFHQLVLLHQLLLPVNLDFIWLKKEYVLLVQEIKSHVKLKFFPFLVQLDTLSIKQAVHLVPPLHNLVKIHA